MEHANIDNGPVIHVDSDDDFMPTNKVSKHSCIISNDSDSDDDLMKSEKVGKPLFVCMLPDGYTYKMVMVTHFKDIDSFNFNFKIKLGTEDSVRT